MQARVVVLTLALLLPAVACGSGAANNTSTSPVLKNLHEPSLAPTATPPVSLPTPLAANGAAGGPGAGTSAQPDTYVVKAGDTLGQIAAQLGVSVGDLASANNISDPTRIQVGQQLKVPKPGAALGTPAPGTPALSTPGPGPTSATGGGQVPPTGGAPSGGGTVGPAPPGSTPGTLGTPGGAAQQYTVKSGDIGSKIALQFGVTCDELAQANGMTKDQLAKLSVGQILKIPPSTGHSGC